MLRPRLLDALADRWRRRVVVIVAGAGFGKTTVLSQAVAQNALAPAGLDIWFGCEAQDRIRGHLAGALAQALGASLPARATELDVASTLVEAMWRRSPVPVALVVDDSHHLSAGSGGAQLLAEILDALPDNAHVVLAGRTEPAVPLARLEAQGGVARLGEGELSFRPAEQEELARRRGVPLDVLGEAGGWPALAELAAAAAPGGSGVERFLWEEVLSRLEPQQRRALACLVAVGGGDAEVAAAAAGVDVELDALIDAVPLVAVDERGRAAPHALWVRALGDELAADEVARARAAAGTVLGARGEHHAAFRLFAAAEDWGSARTVALGAVRATGIDVISPDVLEEWIEALPSDGHPARLLLESVSETVHRTRGDGPIELALQAVEGFRQIGDSESEVLAITRVGYLAFVGNDLELLQPMLGRVLALEAEGCAPARPVAALGRAIIAQLGGDDDAAVDQLGQIPEGALGPEWSARLDWLRAQALINLGRSGEAVDLADRAAAAATATFHGGRAVPWVARWHAGRTGEILARGVNVGMDSPVTEQDRFLTSAAIAGRFAFVGRVGEAQRSLSLDPPIWWADRPVERSCWWS